MGANFKGPTWRCISRIASRAIANGSLTDVPVLAKHASQIAETEKDGSRSIPAAKTIFLTEMRGSTGDASITTCVANLRLVRHGVVTVGKARQDGPVALGVGQVRALTNMSPISYQKTGGPD